MRLLAGSPGGRTAAFRLLAALSCGAALLASRSRAGCDNIPTEIDEFRAVQGAITAPFAIPGQRLQVRVRPAVCDETSSGLGTAPACVSAASLRVTLVFAPGGDAPANAVVLAESCGDPSDPASLQAKVSQWAQALAPAGTATCVTEPDSQLVVAATDVGTGQECRLDFRFPEARGVSLSPPDTLTGPTRIVVEPIGSPLPTAAVSERCADLVRQRSTIACIDELFQLDGSCFTEAENRNPRFADFTALPVPNDFAEMTGPSRPPLRFALDGRGNLLAPVDWSGVLCQADASCKFEGFPPPQLVEVLFPASIGSGLPSAPGAALAVPSRDFTASLTLQGTELPPIFDPSAAAEPGTAGLELFGSTDAVQTVIRLQLEAPGRCSADQTPCVSDLGCPQEGETCALDAPDVQLGDLRYCLAPGACQAPGAAGAPAAPPSGGPGIVPPALYLARTDGFVPLETLNLCRDSKELSCILRDEPLAGVDKNQDGDRLDPSVLTVRERRSGVKLPIGIEGGEGVAAALLHEPPARQGPFATPLFPPPLADSVRPAVAADDQCVALLFAEPWENRSAPEGVDANGDGEAWNSVLRTFCRDAGAPGGIREVAAAAGLGDQLAASAAPLLVESPRTLSPLQGGGEPLVIADQRLYVLLDEAANTPKAGPLRADVDYLGQPGNAPAYDPVSATDGNVVCFASEADLVSTPRDRNRGGPDVYCRDFRTGVTDVVNRYQEKPSKGPLCSGRIVRADAPAFGPSLSADARRICYESAAKNLSPGGVDKNGVSDVFVLDRQTCQTIRVSVTATGAESPLPSTSCSLAGNGAAVAFASQGALAGPDSDGGLEDVFVRALLGGSNEVTDPIRLGTPVAASADLPGSSGRPSLSADGTRVAFENTTAAGTRVVVRDLVAGAAVDVLGFDLPGRRPRLSPDGQTLTLEVPNAQTGAFEAFEVDLATSIARGEAISRPLALSATLEDLQAASGEPDVAGGSAAFTSPAPLVPGDSPGSADPEVHVQDRVTWLLKRVGDGSSQGALSPEGHAVAYVAPANAGTGVFRSGPAIGAGVDLDGNGSADDRVLAMLDLAASPPRFQVLGAATQAGVAGAHAAFVAPDGRAFLGSCAAGAACSVAALTGPASSAPALATGVVVSGEVVCVTLAASGHVACAPVAGGSLTDLGVRGRALAATGPYAVLIDDAAPARLHAFQLSGGAFVPVFTSDPGTRRFVASANGFVAFDRCEADVGADLNGDGPEDECVLDLVNLGTGELLRTGATVIPCTLEACDRRFPWRVFPSGEFGEAATVRFLTLECQEDGDCASCGPGCPPNGRSCDLDLNGSCDDVVVREISSDQREFVLADVGADASADPLAGVDSGGTASQGAVFPSLVGRCDVDRDPATTPTTTPCQSDANCPSGLVCGPPFSVLALNDADGDGIFDNFDDCPNTFDPSQTDSDGDHVGDACDRFDCGDGVVEPGEFCDDGTRNGACANLDLAGCRALAAAGSYCTKACTPEVFADVSESAVNPDQNGVLPATLLGTPLLNLGAARAFDGSSCAIAGGCPAQMIDLATVRLEGILAGAPCSGGGAPIDSYSVADSNGDGLPDLNVKFRVEDASIDAGDDQACTTGAFRTFDGRFHAARFEARDGLNVK